MKLTIDREADALYLSLGDATVTDTDEIAPGIILDYDAENRVVGIEMLHISKRAPEADMRRLLFETLEPAGK